MKLFSQLTEQGQMLVVKYCVNIVLQDILEGNLTLDPMSDDDNELKTELEKALKHIAKLKDDDAKVNYLMDNEVIASAIQEIALEMGKGCWISDDTDMVIDLSELEEEENEQEETELPKLELAPKAKTKKKDTLN